MTGFALELYQNTFLSNRIKSLGLLDDLMRARIIKRIDYQAAIFLAGGKGNSEDLLLLLCFLFSSARMGHLCIELDQLKPSVDEIWKIDSGIEKIEEKILSGYKSTSEEFFKNHLFIKLDQSRLYLDRNWQYEKEIDFYFKELEKKEPFHKIELKDDDLPTTPSQLFAIKNSLNHCLSFISGGPGVGKTFTAAILTQEFLKKIPQGRVAITSPTGKAVANLKQSLDRFLSQESFVIDAMTLHKLFYHKVMSYLPYDLLIVDESSMIDAHFMLCLLKYCKPGSRLIFIGDENQLPPVGSGFVFRDLLNIASHKSMLTECLRTEIKEILNSAQAVRLGQKEEFFSSLTRQGALFDIQDKNYVLEKLLKQIPQVENIQTDYEKLEAFQGYKILSPIRQGEFGIIEINEKIKKLRARFSYHPIIITSNNYKLDLFNGDIGLLNGKNEAIFFARSESELFFDPQERVRRIPQEVLPAYELAYCLSIHKSQGSEYQKVSILIPDAIEVFARELLYTAITRAKKEFEIFSNKHTLSELVTRQHRRISGLGSLHE